MNINDYPRLKRVWEQREKEIKSRNRRWWKFWQGFRKKKGNPKSLINGEGIERG